LLLRQTTFATAGAGDDTELTMVVWIKDTVPSAEVISARSELWRQHFGSQSHRHRSSSAEVRSTSSPWAGESSPKRARLLCIEDRSQGASEYHPPRVLDAALGELRKVSRPVVTSRRRSTIVWSSLWDAMWLFLSFFAFMAYLFALFNVIGDLFRDRKLNGWWKALWIIFLVFVPLLAVLVYLIARGRGMAERNRKDSQQARDAASRYIREVAGDSPAKEIAKAKSLLDSGAISPQEYKAFKAKVLS
jgi:hypothetical protein